MPNPQVFVPPMCNRHDAEIVHELRYRPSDPWRALIITCQLLLFRGTAHDPRIVARTEGDANNLTLILAELGCLACAKPDLFRRAKLVCRKGLEHASKVARGEIFDADYGIKAEE